MTTPRVRPKRAWVWRRWRSSAAHEFQNIVVSEQPDLGLLGDSDDQTFLTSASADIRARAGRLPRKTRRRVFVCRTRSHERREPSVLPDRLGAVGAKAGQPRCRGGRYASGDAARELQGYHRAPQVCQDTRVPSPGVLPHGLAPRRGHHQRPHARGACSPEDETSFVDATRRSAIRPSRRVSAHTSLSRILPAA